MSNMTKIKIVIGIIVALGIMWLGPYAVALGYNLMYDSYEQLVYGSSLWRYGVCILIWQLFCYPFAIMLYAQIVRLDDECIKNIFLANAVIWSLCLLRSWIIFDKTFASRLGEIIGILLLYLVYYGKYYNDKNGNS